MNENITFTPNLMPVKKMKWNPYENYKPINSVVFMEPEPPFKEGNAHGWVKELAYRFFTKNASKGEDMVFDEKE